MGKEKNRKESETKRREEKEKKEGRREIRVK